MDRRWKDHGYLLIAGAIALAIAADIAFNQSRVSFFMIREIIRLQEYIQFWR